MVKFEIFKDAWKPWEAIYQEAADFASSVGRDRLITITAHGAGANNGEGYVTVWYWDELAVA
jgi:hypothetical protein